MADEEPAEAAQLTVMFGLFRIRVLSLVAVILAWLAAASATDAADNRFKVAVLKFGTVNWAMDVIKHHGLDRKNDFSLEVLGLASKNATSVAFLSGEVDAFVTDWFWVLRQRAEGNDVVQVPYSAALGALMVPADSAIRQLEDLKGRSIGIAGGPIDKSWLLLRAYGLDRLKNDFAEVAQPAYAAPPLLNEQLIAGRLDAVLNYWPFAARLEGAGYRRVAGVNDVMRELGMPVAPPLVGFTFARSLATEKPGLLEGFVSALGEASKLLRNSDAEWVRIRPLMKVRSDAEFEALKARYREGILLAWSAEHKLAAKTMFGLLKSIGGDKLTGAGTTFDAGMFWP